MKFGLSEAEYSLFEALVVRPLQREGVRLYVFGSRARGKHHPFSDLDILMVIPEGNSSLGALLAEVREKIEESTFPVKVELVDEAQLADSYRKSVEADKVEI